MTVPRPTVVNADFILGQMARMSPEDRVETIRDIGDVYCLECGHEQPTSGRSCTCTREG